MNKYMKKIMPNINFDWLQSDWTQALYEFSWIYIVSNTPFFALIIMHMFGTEGATLNSSITRALDLYMIPGELLVYVSTLLAPFVYVIVQYARARRHVPMYSLSVALTVIIYSYCLIAFSMYKNNTLVNMSLLESTTPFFYFSALTLWYFSLVFSRKLTKPEKNMGSKAQSLIDNFNKGEM